MSFIPPIPEVPRPYRFAIPPGPKLHTRKIWRLKTLLNVSPSDCQPLGGWKGSSFQMKGTRIGGWGRPGGQRVPNVLLPCAVLVGADGIWRLALSWGHEWWPVSSLYTNRQVIRINTAPAAARALNWDGRFLPRCCLFAICQKLLCSPSRPCRRAAPFCTSAGWLWSYEIDFTNAKWKPLS